MIAKLDNLLRESSLPSLTPDATWQPLEPGNNGVVRNGRDRNGQWQ